MKYGTDEQRQKYLPRMATGEIRAAFSLCEPELGSDVQAIKTSAKKLDDGTYEINGQKMWVTNGLRSGLVFVLVKTDPDAEPAPQGLHLLHRREGAGRVGEHRRLRRPDRPAADQEDGLQGRRVHRAGLRRLQVPGREHPRRRGGRPQQGLRADDGRARGRPRERRRPRRRPGPARARAGPALLAGAQDVRQADRPAPGDPVQARRHGHAGRRRAPADASGGAAEGRRRALGHGGRHGQAVRVGGRALLRRGVPAHPRRLRLLQGVRDRAASTATRRCC